MDIVITGHHVNVTDGVRNFVEKKLKRVGNHFSRVSKIDVVLHKSNGTYRSEATVHANKFHIHAKSEASDMFTAIHGMSSKLDRQVVKHKELITDHGRHSDRQKTIRH